MERARDRLEVLDRIHYCEENPLKCQGMMISASDIQDREKIQINWEVFC